MAETDLGNQLLEAPAVGRAGAGLAQILVDDLDPLARPAEILGAIDQAVLQLGALLVMLDLGHRGLAHVDIGQLGAAGRGQPLVRRVRDAQHRSSP